MEGVSGWVVWVDAYDENCSRGRLSWISAASCVAGSGGFRGLGGST